MRIRLPLDINRHRDEPTSEPSAVERTALERAFGHVWDQGNAAGLDGWTGPGRGAGEVDDEAIRLRQRDVDHCLALLAPATQPAADTERDERLREGRHLAGQSCDLLNKGYLDRALIALDDELTRLDAVVTAQAATIARLHDVGSGIVSHRYEGDCPVGPPFSPTKRDPACPACRALDRGAR